MEQLRNYAWTCTGKWFCSATAALLPRNILEIERLAEKTPPVPSGSGAAQFSQLLKSVKHPERPFVPGLSKLGVKINTFLPKPASEDKPKTENRKQSFMLVANYYSNNDSSKFKVITL